jgi:hypothetical protein
MPLVVFGGRVGSPHELREPVSICPRTNSVRQIGPIVDKQTVRWHLDGYEEEEYPDRSGPELYRAMRDYPRTGSGA